MRHEAKGSSAGSTEAGSNSRGVLRRALVTRGASSDSNGSGAPSIPSRSDAPIAALALAIAALRSPPLRLSPPPDRDHPGRLRRLLHHRPGRPGKVNPEGGGFLTQTTTSSSSRPTGPTGPTLMPSGSFIHCPAEHKPVGTELTGLKNGTQYFVRLLRNTRLRRSAGPTRNVPPPPIPPSPPSSPAADDSRHGHRRRGLLHLGEWHRRSQTPGRLRPLRRQPCHFEYVTDAQFAATGFNGATAVRQRTDRPRRGPQSGHRPSPPARDRPEPQATTYHLRLVAENAARHRHQRSGLHLHDPAQVAEPTVLATDDASGVSKRSPKPRAKSNAPPAPIPPWTSAAASSS